MKRLLLITLLVLSSGPAYGEWVSIVSSDSLGGYTTYVDPDTVRRKGNLVKIWSLNDFKTVQIARGNSYWSSKTLDEYNCTEEQIRNLAYYSYSGRWELVRWCIPAQTQVSGNSHAKFCGSNCVESCVRQAVIAQPQSTFDVDKVTQ